MCDIGHEAATMQSTACKLPDYTCLLRVQCSLHGEAEMSTRSLVKAATTTESGRPSAARLPSRLNSASSGRRLRPHRSSRVRAHPFAPRASFRRPCRWWTQLEAHEHVEAAPDRFSATPTALGQQPAAIERVTASPRQPHSGRTAASSTSPSLRFLSKDSRFRE